jgi:hypothetical protein
MNPASLDEGEGKSEGTLNPFNPDVFLRSATSEKNQLNLSLSRAFHREYQLYLKSIVIIYSIKKTKTSY